MRFVRGSRLPASWKFFKSDIPETTGESRGKRLWIRSLKRVRAQLTVVNAFRESLTNSIIDEVPTSKSRWIESVKKVKTQLKVIKAFNIENNDNPMKKIL